jgi:hypothetical protein
MGRKPQVDRSPEEEWQIVQEVLRRQYREQTSVSTRGY